MVQRSTINLDDTTVHLRNLVGGDKLNVLNYAVLKTAQDEMTVADKSVREDYDE